MVATPLTPIVTNARIAAVLAAHPTVLAAAVDAIAAAITGGDVIPEFNDGTIFAVVDKDGRRTWIEVGPDGGLTQRSADKIAEFIVGAVEMNSAVTGLAFVVTDEDERCTDLELGLDGRFSQRVVDSLGSRIAGLVGTARLDWIIWSGDSLTMGTGGIPAPTQLMALEPDWNVINMGVGGETSTTIAGRMGGRPMLVTIPSGAIPASGGVTVTLSSDDGEAVPLPLLQNAGGGGVNPVRIAGVEGTLTVASGVYTFTRSLAGSSVPVIGLKPLITQAMRDYRSGIHVLWWGINDGASDALHIIARERAFIEWLVDPVPRYLVIGTSGGIGRATINPQLLQEFGRRYIDVLAYLKSDAAFAAAGLTKTGQDVSDIGNNLVPTSFRSDSTHFNDAGYLLVAKLVRDRVLELGWK